MTLTGIDPNDPTPATRRELIFGAGLSSGGTSRDVVLFGSYTTAIPAVAPATWKDIQNTLGVAVADDADCRARFGQRSELYRMYRSYVAVDPSATIYCVPVTAAVGGVAGYCTLTYVVVPGPACTTATTQEIVIQGTVITVPIAVGDTAIVIGGNVTAAINAADDGKLEVIATDGGAGVVTVECTAANVRGAHIIGNTAVPTHGLRVRFQSPTNVTCAKANPALGEAAGIDDFGPALASVENSEIYYHVTPKHTTNAAAGTLLGDLTALSATDGGIGTHVASITTQAQPINGKEQVLIAALVLTQAQRTSVTTSSFVNSARAFFFSQENSDCTPAMIAAHNAAVVRINQVAHPGANFAGYSNTDTTVYRMLPPFNIGDRPTAVEIRADLNNGVSPIACTANGKPYLVRFITSRSIAADNTSHDYRARPGHVTSVLDFTWGVIKARWLTTKQPFVADDPAEGQKPTIKTSTPGYLKALIYNVIDDLASNKPLGKYDGPILAPDKVTQMKASVNTSRIAAGLTGAANFYAVEHLYKGEFTLRETGESY